MDVAAVDHWRWPTIASAAGPSMASTAVARHWRWPHRRRRPSHAPRHSCYQSSSLLSHSVWRVAPTRRHGASPRSQDAILIRGGLQPKAAALAGHARRWRSPAGVGRATRDAARVPGAMRVRGAAAMRADRCVGGSRVVPLRAQGVGRRKGCGAEGHGHKNTTYIVAPNGTACQCRAARPHGSAPQAASAARDSSPVPGTPAVARARAFGGVFGYNTVDRGAGVVAPAPSWSRYGQ